MSVRTVATKFMELCRAGKNFEVMRTMYAPEMVSVEGDGKETIGQQAVIRKSEIWRANNTIRSDKLRGPFFCGDANASSGRFAVFFTTDITRNATGERVTLEEVGLYTVKDDKITREEFYYDGTF
jgi:SnoaL-like domain